MAVRTLYLVTLLAVAGFFARHTAASEKAELIEAVLKQAEANKGSHSNTTVTVNVAVIQITGFDDATQSLKAKINFSQVWDSKLGWEDEKYAKIKQIKVELDKIWHPNVVDMAESQGENVVIAKSGIATCSAAMDIEADCSESYDTSSFPMDKRTCKFKLPTVDQADGTEVNIEGGSLSKGAAKRSALFTVEGGNVAVEDDEEGETSIGLEIEIQRGNVAFYQHFIKFPFMILCFFTAVPFALAANSQWKVPFASAIFIGFTIFGLILYQYMGTAILFASEGTPDLAKLWHFNFVMAAVTIYQVAANFDMTLKKTEVPGWMKKVFIKGLATVLLCGCFEKLKKKKDKKTAKKDEEAAEEVPMTQTDDVVVQTAPDDDSATNKADKNAEDWLTVASVIDRICLIFWYIHAGVTIYLYLP